MSKYRSSVPLRHMLDHAQEALSLATGKTRQDLDKDRMLNLSLTRLLEILGEAANRIPLEDQSDYPDIPWPQIIGLRNRLIHGYNEVDFNLLWSIIQDDLPGLVKVLERILNG